MFELIRESAVPLVDQIGERITQLVRHGQLAAGTRLPSIRKLARLIGASPFTVVDAYDRLVARGLIESRAGRGFFVTSSAVGAARRHRGAARHGLRRAGAGAAVAVAVRRPHCRRAPDSCRRTGCWRRRRQHPDAPRRAADARRPGCPARRRDCCELREQIASRLAAARHRRERGQHHDDLRRLAGLRPARRILLTPGDAVLVEDPGYFVLFEQLRAHHVRLIPIPRRRRRPGSGGARSRLPRPSAARVLHADTAAQSDRHERRAGALPSRSVARRAVRLCRSSRTTSTVTSTRAPAVRLAQIDGLRHVIYVGSYTQAHRSFAAGRVRGS